MGKLLIVFGLFAGTALAEPLPRPEQTPFAPFLLAQDFTCSGKTCGEMSSCAEACHALLVCGDGRRDADNDGIPCESICSEPC